MEEPVIALEGDHPAAVWHPRNRLHVGISLVFDGAADSAGDRRDILELRDRQVAGPVVIE